MHPKELHIADYTYDLPDEKVAKYPLAVRDASKLLIYSNGRIQEDNYRNIAAHIPHNSLVVYNQTKVVHARLLFQKATGGQIEVFCLEPGDEYADIQTAMLQKDSVRWKCMIGGASKWKHGMVLQLECPPHFTLSAEIVDRQSGSFTVQLSWDKEGVSFAEVLHHAGKVPLPPYLHREAEASDEERYQTIFAKEEGSVAAPTAGLHFTEHVVKSLDEKGIDKAMISLHVGAGTFKPVQSDTMLEHEMHAEWIEVDMATIEKLITEHNVIAVGTTSMRTLESLYWIGNKLFRGQQVHFAGIAVQQWDPYETEARASAFEALKSIQLYMQNNKLERIITRTRILIAPGYRFRIVSGLVTNFHQPQSTLLLLIAAFIGDDWRRVYEHALNNDFRFLSYGDGCLLWHNKPNVNS
ncbi:MAG: S-adenosylmethionine tRNA ribosyltransferase [Bacteroidetes bacterium 46-16]|nr:MAG: S-adenosylmethionine tRNA ribosyltransferase [Bacteroidetes bacterium 46-16]